MYCNAWHNSGYQLPVLWQIKAYPEIWIVEVFVDGSESRLVQTRAKLPSWVRREAFFVELEPVKHKAKRKRQPEERGKAKRPTCRRNPHDAPSPKQRCGRKSMQTNYQQRDDTLHCKRHTYQRSPAGRFDQGGSCSCSLSMIVVSLFLKTWGRIGCCTWSECQIGWLALDGPLVVVVPTCDWWLACP